MSIHTSQANVLKHRSSCCVHYGLHLGHFISEGRWETVLSPEQLSVCMASFRCFVFMRNSFSPAFTSFNQHRRELFFPCDHTIQIHLTFTMEATKVTGRVFFSERKLHILYEKYKRSEICCRCKRHFLIDWNLCDVPLCLFRPRTRFSQHANNTNNWHYFLRCRWKVAHDVWGAWIKAIV